MLPAPIVQRMCHRLRFAAQLPMAAVHAQLVQRWTAAHGRLLCAARRMALPKTIAAPCPASTPDPPSPKQAHPPHSLTLSTGMKLVPSPWTHLCQARAGHHAAVQRAQRGPLRGVAPAAATLLGRRLAALLALSQARRVAAAQHRRIELNPVALPWRGGKDRRRQHGRRGAVRPHSAWPSVCSA